MKINSPVKNDVISAWFDKKITKSITLPLIVSFLVSIVLHWGLDFDGFFLNLATEIIGIIITVAYIDYILDRQKNEEWKATRAIVAIRVQKFVMGSINNCHEGLKFVPADIVIRITSRTPGTEYLAQNILDAARSNLSFSETQKRLNLFDNSDWKYLSAKMVTVSEEADKLLLHFGEKITSQQYQLILETQSTAELVDYIIKMLLSVNDGIGDAIPENLPSLKELLTQKGVNWEEFSKYVQDSKVTTKYAISSQIELLQATLSKLLLTVNEAE